MSGSPGPNLGLVYGYSPGDNGWGVGGFNPDMAQLDTLVMLTVINTTLLTPPGSPSDGDRYIIGGTGTGDWAGEDQAVAVWVAANTAWTFYTPMEGWLAYDLHSSGEFRFDGSVWNAVAGGSETLEDLTDVQITSVANGQVLTWNSGASKWENQAPSGGALASLTDVQLSGPTNGQILSYNTGATKWENTTNSVENLSDVDITSVADGQVLAWNAGASKWENVDQSGGASYSFQGAWNGDSAYSVNDVVTHNSAAFLCYESVSAPVSSPSVWANADSSGVVIGTTNIANDKATNSGGNGSYALTPDLQVSGKYYFEMTFSNRLNNNTGAGIATANAAQYAIMTFLGGYHSTFSGASGGGSVGEAVGTSAFAVDLDNNLIYFAQNAAAINWNGVSGNPATQTGGATIGTIPGGGVGPAFLTNSSGEIATLTASNAHIIGVIPSGFVLWPHSATPNPDPESDDAHWIGGGGGGGGGTLEDLTDVQITSVSNGQVLAWNSTDSKWENVDAGGGALASLSDVQLTTLSNGQVLTYNSGASKWENVAPNLDLAGLTGDVDITSPSDGQILTYNGGASKWENEAAPPPSFTNSGDWSGLDSYSPGDVVIFNQSAYLCYEPVSAPPSGAPTLDGSNGVGGIQPSSSITLTTTNASDLIVFISSAGIGLSTVTSAGLTFTRRASFSGAGGVLDYWTAPASAPLVSQTISFTYASDQFFQVCAFGLENFNAFDSHSGLPVTGSSGTVTLNTTDSNDFILYIEGGGSGGTQTPPAGFTNIYSGDIDGQTLGVSYQRVNAPQSGVSFTVPSNDAIMIDGLAATGAPTPNATPADDPEHWVGQGNSALLPTSANTGLTTWLHQNGATVADTAAGVLITGAPGSGANLSERTMTAPATPYTITAKIAMTGVQTTFDHVNIGWYDGSAKLHVMDLVWNTSNYLQLEVTEWTSTTSFSAKSSGAGTPTAIPNPIWMQIEDDGTDIHFSFSVDGENFLQLYSAAKAGAFLTGSYTDVVFGVNNQETSGNILGTLLSWTVS